MKCKHPECNAEAGRNAGLCNPHYALKMKEYRNARKVGDAIVTPSPRITDDLKEMDSYVKYFMLSLCVNERERLEMREKIQTIEFAKQQHLLASGMERVFQEAFEASEVALAERFSKKASPVVEASETLPVVESAPQTLEFIQDTPQTDSVEEITPSVTLDVAHVS